MLRKYLFVCAVCVVTGTVNTQESDTVVGITDKITADGFPHETHHVTTIDGYILGMHRIPNGRQGPSTDTDRPVVLLIHGLMSSSEAFIVLQSDNSVAYNLADAGFDVWMGNARGNRYSRRHNSLDPDHETQKVQFFDFTFEEIGLYDLPAMIDYILEVTGRQRLHYIGHSQGGTAFLVMGALRPDYNNKIISAHLLAAVGYQEHFPNARLAAAAEATDVLYQTALGMNIVELDDFIENFVPSSYTRGNNCYGKLHQRFMCAVVEVNQALVRSSSSREYVYTAGGASLKQVAHYGQNIRDKLFRRYHFGTAANSVIYGLEEPPLYDLSLVTAHVTMHYTVSDHLLDERDVLAMADDMPNTIVRRVARDTFLHEDFVVAMDAKELVTDYIIEAILTSPDIQDDTSTGSDSVIIVDGDDGVTTPNPDDDDDGNSAASAMLNIYLILFSFILLLK